MAGQRNMLSFSAIESYEPMILMSATTIEGTDAAEWISGDECDNQIFGFGGDDELHAPLGDNSIDGGDGVDTLVIYEGVRSQYQLSRLDESSIEVLGPGLDGTTNSNLISNVERIIFNDGSVDTSTITGPDDDPPDDDPADDDAADDDAADDDAADDDLADDDAADDDPADDDAADDDPADDDPADDDAADDDAADDDAADDDAADDDPQATILGTDAGEWLNGTEADDVIYGLDGNDEIYAPIGNNFINGGDGLDTLVIYSGGVEEYAVVDSADGSVVVTGPGLNESIVVNTLLNVERIVFNDGALPLESLPTDDLFDDDPPDDDLPSTLNGQTIFHHNEHLYMLTSESSSWTAAQIEAELYGGNLVSMGSAAEEIWLQNTFGNGEFWIGMNDAAVEESFVWASGELITYTNWSIGQPDNAGNQDFGVLTLAEGTSWDDRHNASSLFGIIEIGVDELDGPDQNVLPNGSGFTTETVVSGLVQPIAFAEAYDGTIFVAEKSGLVKVAQDGIVVGTLIDLTDEVDTVQDRGLLGVEVDPNFAVNGYVYLQYVVDTTPGDDSFDTPAMGQLIRVTAESDPVNGYAAVEGSRVVIQDGHLMSHATHSIGDVDFDAEGNLLYTWGDGGFDDTLRLSSQDPNSPQGKLFRIDPVTLEGIPENPFYDADNPGGISSRVLAMGIRNSWKFSIDEATGDIYLGEVTDEGPEEINVVRADGSSLPNFGWPYFEGDNPTQHAVAPPGFTYESPFIQVAHGNVDDDAILGGDIFRGHAYPDVYDGRYFFGNFGFAQGRISTADGSGSVEAFGQNGDYPGLVDMQQASDGHIWIMSIVSGDIQRLVFNGDDFQSNRDPIAAASADRTAGVGPLEIVFSSLGSTDADGDDLLLAWDFESDGIIDAVTNSVAHEYQQSGRSVATLIVSDGNGGADSQILEVDVLDNDPTDGNVVLGRPAEQTGVLDGGLASRAVDGNADGTFANESVTQTARVRTPFWQTDLGQSLGIGEVMLSSRTDGGPGSDLSNFWVLISDSPFTSANLDAVRADPNVEAVHFAGTANDQASVFVNANGRYLRIQREGIDDILSIAEVRVFVA